MVNFSIGELLIPEPYSFTGDYRDCQALTVGLPDYEAGLRFLAKSTGEETISFLVIMHGTSAERRIDTSNRQG